jgi:leucyl aminopeptidase (aminopeptidase T)
MVVTVLATGLSLPAPRADAAKDVKQKETNGRDLEALADKLVTQCLRVNDKDLVQITGGVNDAELLENLAVHVRKAGGQPHIELISARLSRRLVDDVPAKYDSQKPELALKLADTLTATITVESYDMESAMAGVAPERTAAIAKAAEPVMDKFLQRNVRQIALGNGLYPLPERAKRFGVSQEELAKIFWAGVNVDYTKLQATGEEVKKILSSGKKAHLTHANGTDLTVKIEERPVYVSDGVISADKAKRGGVACQAWLPAGEVYVVPVPGTAEGKVVIDHLTFDNKDVTGLTLTFKAGKMTKMEAKSGLEPIEKMYKAAGEGDGRDDFGALDVGINPNVHLVPNSKMISWVPAGMVSFGVGNNVWAGGDSKSAFAVYGNQPGCTLTIDDKVLVDKGELKLN